MGEEKVLDGLLTCLYLALPGTVAFFLSTERVGEGKGGGGGGRRVSIYSLI